MTEANFYNYLMQNGIEESISDVASMIEEGTLLYEDFESGLDLYCTNNDISFADKSYFIEEVKSQLE